MNIVHLIPIILVFSFTRLLSAETTNIQNTNLAELGIKYDLKKLDKPIPNRIHILRINLSSKKLEPKVELGPDPDENGPCLLYTSPSPRDS